MELHEIHKYELFDAVDAQGNKLDIDMVRGQKYPEGLYHVVVEIITMNEHEHILVTKRHPKKNYGGYWEITGGSILKGEATLEGAVRELQEETGLMTTQSALKPIYETIFYDGLFRGFFQQIHTDHQKIVLQDDETIEYQWIPKCDFVEFINRADFLPFTRARILRAWEVLESYIYC